MNKSFQARLEDLQGNGPALRPKNACLIYIFGEENGKYIKIGKTRNHIEFRMRQHEQRGPEESPMRVLAAMWGMDSDEKALKRHWKNSATNGGGEWLRPDEPLREWIRFLRQQSYVVTDNSEDIGQKPMADSRFWLPNPKHACAARQTAFQFKDDPWADLDFDDEVGDGDFYTNPLIIEAARLSMGGIDLDPASCRKANHIVKAPKFFNAAMDGLLQKWDAARVWLNPPFNQWDQWGPKIIGELHNGFVEQLCVLVPTRSLTAKACNPMLRSSVAIAICFGRIPFHGPKAGSPDDGHAILYFGHNAEHFHAAFQSIAVTFETRAARRPHEAPRHQSCS